MNTGMGKSYMRKEKLNQRNRLTKNQLSYISERAVENVRNLLPYQNEIGRAHV